MQNESKSPFVVDLCRTERKKKDIKSKILYIIITNSCVEVDSERGEIIVTLPNQPVRNFFFDKVYGQDSTQELVFQETAMPIVESVCQGYNGTIFAYGQTGTGKTFTMEGDFCTDINKGIIPRSFDLMFSLIQGTYNTNYLIRCSYLELYNEEVRDLLSKTHSQKLDIREDPESGFYVEDLSSWVVKSPAEMVELMLRGRELKIIKGHNMNERSSRSHCIFSIIVENSTKDEKGGDHIRKGKLNLVDLAGSERTSKIKDDTGAVGGLQKETIHINLSLTALGKVICALVSNKKQHIPYRDSKLTKLLMDSLGGNSKTVMIANIGPADYNYEETVTTLRYADRAKNIKNAPKINEDPKDAMIRQYQEELAKLKQALAAANGGQEISLTSLETDNTITSESKKKIQELEGKFKAEKDAILKKNEEEKKKIEESKNLVEAEKYKLLEELKKKQEEQEKRNQAREKLVNKLKMLEDKIVPGEQNKKKAEENERLLKKAREELEQREKNRIELQKKIKENEENIMKLQVKYHDQDTEIAEKSKLFEILKQKRDIQLKEKEDLEKDHEQRQNEFMEQKKEYEKEISKKKAIITALIPRKYLHIIEALSDYNDEKDEWYLKEFEEMDNETRKQQQLAMGYDDEDEYYDQGNDQVPLREIIELGNQPKSVYLNYENFIKPKKKKIIK